MVIQFIAQTLKAAGAETWKRILAVNIPNGLVIGIINIGKIQAVATLVLTILSILSTGLILWLNLRKINNDKK